MGADLIIPAELRALSEAAAKGPWSHRPLMSDKGSEWRERFITDGLTNLADDMEPEDAEFVCALVNWFRSLPALPRTEGA
ncbi:MULTISPECIES: hypothetical protein [Methylobacteriaceae]|uniref:Uncharacterized protein n=1 Tax=Methylorubrum extorquens (strain ATCC 14718 / DSM 1338 / JCM 2805 / NCIMB 9133 / AM1) TaxID=272630 RepID=C5B198_METEA|nr:MULTISPECIES: hypothetical protein [Methylobacteriaceae]ACS41699.1 hypothetical protein MexAM1_META1p4025 [Methylorubrum extorquens AM1]MCP1545284.1 hypothetical protein [Methylorubrum extorquens]MCP1587369.1 hypothetical protein [Methylorubrum extorquens]PXW51314.1 hypothetical protein BY998_13535 [Methylobacterium sp. B4]